MIRVSNSLDPDQDGHSVGADLGPNCLQRLTADNTSKQRPTYLCFLTNKNVLLCLLYMSVYIFLESCKNI